MTRQLENLAGNQIEELYFHFPALYERDQMEALGMALESGIPLFSLHGRGAVCRTQSVRGSSFQGFGDELVFRIPNSSGNTVVTQMFRSDFEPDDSNNYPLWYALAERCPREHAVAAIEWLSRQQQSWQSGIFGPATLHDVRALSASYYLGIY